jgi:hypothetical protein
MQANRLNLSNVIAIAVCLAAMTMFTSCEKDNQTEKSLFGKWVTSDFHAGNTDTIVFAFILVVEKYFDYFDSEEVFFRVTYSLASSKITFTISHEDLTGSGPIYMPHSETFECILKKNSLTIKDFSNPFSGTLEMRRDVRFKKVK